MPLFFFSMLFQVGSTEMWREIDRFLVFLSFGQTSQITLLLLRGWPMLFNGRNKDLKRAEAMATSLFYWHAADGIHY